VIEKTKDWLARGVLTLVLAAILIAAVASLIGSDQAEGW
jgi:hypothetical protein